MPQLLVVNPKHEMDGTHVRKITVVSDTPMRVALVGVDAANLYES